MTWESRGSPVLSHDVMTAVGSDCLKSRHLHHRWEPRLRYRTSENQPDIVLFDQSTVVEFDLDVSLVYPWGLDILSRAARVDGATAPTKREDDKNQIWKRNNFRGVDSKSGPLVFERFGWSLGVLKHINIWISWRNYQRTLVVRKKRWTVGNGTEKNSLCLPATYPETISKNELRQLNVVYFKTWKFWVG